MPTDKKVKNLVFNVLTEEQYESATKNEDEFYLTPDNSAEIEKVIPTDVAIKDNKLGLEHDSVWLTNQNAINLEGFTYDEATKTLKAGGKSVPPTLNLIDFGAEIFTIRTSITEEEYNNLKNGLYNQVVYADEENSAGLYMPSKLFDIGKGYAFTQIVATSTDDNSLTYSAIRTYSITFGEKNTSNEYPITITKALDINPASTEDSRIGDLTGLKTNAKDTVVNAINEVEEETDNIAKVTPTDIKIVNDEITLMHDGTEITGQGNKIGTEATDLASLETNAEPPSGTTATLLTTLKIGDTYYKIIEPVAVEITAKADATNGTITDSQLATLQASDSNYVMFNHEKFFLNDDGAKEGFLTYTHVGHENSKTTLKFFTVTVSTKAWVLTTQSIQTINVIENSDDTVSLEIS